MKSTTSGNAHPRDIRTNAVAITPRCNNRLVAIITPVLFYCTVNCNHV